MRFSPKYQLFVGVLIVFLLSGCSGTSRAKRADVAVKTARSYIGTPYKYGGTTRAGIDCSALVYHSYKAAKVSLPRTSKEQSKKGEKVNKNNLKVGDIVFFATGDKKREINHAGIVSSAKGGNIRFIHASTSIGVTESSLSSEYYRKRFRKAKRVL